MQNFLRFLKIPRKPLGFPRMARRKPDAAGRNRAMAARIRYFAWEQNAGRALSCFPAGLLRRSPHASGVCFGRSFHLRRPGKRSPARAVPVQKSSAQSAHVSPMRRPKNVVPRQRPFPLGSKAQPMPPQPSPAQKGTARLHARSPRCVSGHCARSIRQTMAEICPRVMVLAGLKVLVPLEK